MECFLTMNFGKMTIALTIDLFFLDIHAFDFICIPINETDAVNAINGTIITYGQVRYSISISISISIGRDSRYHYSNFQKEKKYQHS